MKKSDIKFETLRVSYIKPIVIGIVLFVVVMSVLMLRGTMAKYVYKQSVKLAEGTINYKMPDFNLLALNIQDESGEYVSASSVPSEGYTLNEEMSYCEKLETDGTRTTLSDVTIEYKDGALYFGEITQNGTKCYVYFDVYNNPYAARDYILSNKTISTRDDFSVTLESDTTGTIYQTEDDDGTTYYFAGAPTDNYVYFAGYYWRIIRVNGDGSIRLIYNGISTEATGESTQIGEETFSGGDNAYVGFMYTSGLVHGLDNDSKVKGVLDTWYTSNLTSYASYIDMNAGFCGDRAPSTDYNKSNGLGGTGETITYYGALIRLDTNKTPSYKCTYSEDLYTVSSSTKGNKALTNPIGLITADEVAYAGGVVGINNTSYYLYTNQYYWTISPGGYESSIDAVVLHVRSSGDLYNNTSYSLSYGVRPVINLRSDVTLSGSGTSSDPYLVVGT